MLRKERQILLIVNVLELDQIPIGDGQECVVVHHLVPHREVLAPLGCANGDWVNAVISYATVKHGELIPPIFFVASQRGKSVGLS